MPKARVSTLILCAFVAAAATASDEMAPKNCNCDNYWISWSPATGGIPRTCASLALYSMSQQDKCMVSMLGQDSSCPNTYKCESGNPSETHLPAVTCVFEVQNKDANGNCTGEIIIWTYINPNCFVSSPAENPDSGCDAIAYLAISGDRGT
jgi:hypothetical protein